MGDNALTVRDGWMLRVLRALHLVEVRDDGTVDHSAGADFATDQGVARGYKAITSMSAMAAFPWVQAAVSAVASDLSGLELRVIRGRGADAEPDPDHPILDLLERPSSRVPGVLFRRQLVTDLVLTGCSYSLIGGASEPAALIRLHPERVKVIPNPDGAGPGAYEYDTGGKIVRYTWEQVLHIRLPSWEDTPAGLYGTGAIRALNNDLTTDLRSQELAAATAKTGRPTGVFSPSDPSDRWSGEQIKVLREAYEKQMRGVSGALFLGGPVKYDALGFSPRDMEYQATRTWVRDAVLAAIGVVPTRVGIPSANYSTAAQSARRYWEDIQARSLLIDAELTRLARMFPGSEGIRVFHSFDDVAALQESRTDRQNRVNLWWMMGIPLADAAAMEGFADLPVPEIEEDAPAAPTAGEQPVSAQALNGAQIGSLMEILAAVAAGGLTDAAAVALIGVAFPTITPEDARDIVAGARAIPEDTPTETARTLISRMMADRGIASMDPLARWLVLEGGQAFQAPQTEEGRAELWRGFIENVHGPAERDNGLAMRRYLRAYGARVAKRLAENIDRDMGGRIITRQIDDIALDKILDPAAEAKLVLNIFRPLFRKMIRRAIDAAMKLLPVDFDFSPDRIDTQVDLDIGQMITRVADTTKTQVRDLVRAELSLGSTINEMQAKLIQSQSFSPARALTIARTETTRSVNAGAKAAIKEAQGLGANVIEEWVSARDDAVRDTHRELDGQKIGPGEVFEIDGQTAAFPGDFGDGALDINCRCVAVPFVVGLS